MATVRHHTQVLVRGVPIRAHECVSDASLFIAADRLARMLRHMPDAVSRELLKFWRPRSIMWRDTRL